IPLVAIATTFQTFPQALVYDSDSPIENFEELEGRSIYVYVGSAYLEYVKKTYNLKEIKEFKFNGHSEFAANPGSLAQAYATNQPYGLEKLGVSAGIKLIADSGYKPYNNIIFTTQDVLKEHPETVKAFLAATMKGWNYYFEHYEDINTILLEENPD